MATTQSLVGKFLLLMAVGGGIIVLFVLLEQYNILDASHIFSQVYVPRKSKGYVNNDSGYQAILSTRASTTKAESTTASTASTTETLSTTASTTKAESTTASTASTTETTSTRMAAPKTTKEASIPETTKANTLKQKSSTEDSLSNDKTTKPSWLTATFLRDNLLGKFPSESVCHYLGIRKEPTESEKESKPPNILCKVHRPDRGSCEAANSYFHKPGYVEDRKCDETKHADICRFQKKGNDSIYKLECDIQLCGGSTLTIGSINTEQGIITNWESVQPFSVNKVLEYVKRNAAAGFDFCFMKCGSIFQALIFPPVVKEKKIVDKRRKVNINVVVLDSIARQHFYRTMPKSVAALRKIIYDKSIPATALDFELFQAISQHTFDNIRPLFSGIVRGDAHFSSDFKKAENPLGIPILYGKFRKYGYQTMFQEDICWFDHWGIMLTDVERRRQPGSASEFKSRWKEFNDQVSKYNTDKYGLTHFACHVIQKYGYTNHYDRPSKVCLNGQFFSRYFLDYISSIFQAVAEDKSAAPLISYSHFNTGHTPSGTRIRNVDMSLPGFLLKMAHNPDTVTILIADHGHTRTGYGQTTEGRHELFSPTFFMILPYYAARVLGKDRVAALVENQRRLFTTADIHKALMSLDDPTKSESRDPNVAGIFAVLPGNRTCADLPLMPLSRCKCEGQEQHVADNAPKQKWLAEFAVGQLNNIIQEQYLKGQSGSEIRGYGKCTRLVGASYDHSVERQSGSSIITDFDIHFIPPAGFKEDEIIKVEVVHPLKPENGVTMKSFDRQSQYSKFTSCADKSVNIKLCACANGETKSIIETTDDMKKFIAQPMFGSKTELKDLHSGCLFLMKRRHNTIAVAYEIANVCSDKTFRVTVSGSNYNMLLSRSVPMTVTVKPRTIHFLLSAIRYVMNDSYFDFKPSVELLS